MELSWKSRVSPIETQAMLDSHATHRSPMGVPRTSYIWKYHGTPMQVIWKYHGTPMQVPWDSHETSVEYTWDYSLNQVPWESRTLTSQGNATELVWCFHGTSITFLGSFHGWCGSINGPQQYGNTN